MLEFLFGILPLIFVCSAIGILLLNFPAVSAYLIYVISMMIKPQELYETTQQLAVPAAQPHKNSNGIFLPFIRMATLFRVLFLPDLNIEKMTSNTKESPEESLRNIYSEKAQEEINKYQIKTYSAHGLSDHSKFRNSYEPVEKLPISTEFQKAFPDLTKKLVPAEQKAQPPLPTLNNGEMKITVSTLQDKH